MSASIDQTKLYLIEDPAGGVTKIGISANPEKRLATLQTANPNPLYLRYVVDCQRGRAGSVEADIHAEYRSFRASGEWFKLAADQIVPDLQDHRRVVAVIARDMPPEPKKQRRIAHKPTFTFGYYAKTTAYFWLVLAFMVAVWTVALTAGQHIPWVEFWGYVVITVASIGGGFCGLVGMVHAAAVDTVAEYVEG